MKKIFYITLFCFFVSAEAFFIPPPPPPMFKVPLYSEDAEEEIPDFKERHKDEMNAEDYYELGLLHILIHKNRQARFYLNKAIKSDPKLLNAWIQLGILDLWAQKFDKAYQRFNKALALEPCDRDATHGLLLVGREWAENGSRRSETLSIFQRIYHCDPKNPDILVFYARHLLYANDFDKAEALLKECLDIDSDNVSAARLLVRIYIKQKKWELAREVSIEHLDGRQEAKSLGKIAKNRGDLPRAEKRYRESITKKKEHNDARRELSRVLTAQRKYKEARDQYQEFLSHDPNNQTILRELFEVKSFTNPFWVNTVKHTAAKESDPNLGIPVVTDFYTNFVSRYSFPKPDRYIFEVDLLYFNQREEDIVNNTTNFNATLLGTQFNAKGLFGESWQWVINLREYNAWSNNKNVNFPFKNTFRFEPGVSLIYHEGPHLANGNIHIESQFIKNFSESKSEALKQEQVKLGYLFRPDILYEPEFFISLSEMKYDSSPENWRNRERFEFLSQVPFYEENLSWFYRFRYTHFDKLNEDYFSYKHQYRNMVGFKLHYDIMERATLNIQYDYRWKHTIDLLEPIGTFIFESEDQKLTENKILVNVSYRYRDQLQLIAEGFFFSSTLPYKEWNLNGSLKWIF